MDCVTNSHVAHVAAICFIRFQASGTSCGPRGLVETADFQTNTIYRLITERDLKQQDFPMDILKVQVRLANNGMHRVTDRSRLPVMPSVGDK